MKSLREYVLDRDIVVDIQDGPNHVTEVQLDAQPWEHHAYTLLLTNRALGTSMSVPWMQGLGITRDPDEHPESVISCLMSDAWSFETTNDFEDWAAEYGYDSDSRKAEALYRETRRKAEEFVAFIGGRAELERLARNYERP